LPDSHQIFSLFPLFYSPLPTVVACSRRAAVNPQANARPPQKRLIPFVLSIPKRVDLYFERYPARRVFWSGLSAGAGFYAGNTITLSFGALAINDVLAAVITMVFYEVVSNAFYSSERPSLRLWFANFFKIGVVAALMADAIKLGS
jgi:Protein of unknown function (DUF565)